MQLILQTSHATLRWARFNRAIYQALQQPKHFDRILFLMRRAPEEMRKLIQVQPPNMTNNIIQFLSTCTSEYPLLSESETRQIRAVIKSLAKYTAEICKCLLSCLLLSISPYCSPSRKLRPVRVV